MYSSSSRVADLRNQDGSTNIMCYSCGEFICRTFNRMSSRALCEMCRRVQNGEPLTEEMIKAYRLQKAGKTDVSLLVIPDEPPKKFSLRGLGGPMTETVGFLKKLKPKIAKKSIAVAKAKRRPRLFQNVDLEEDLKQPETIGSMEEIDSSLNKNS